VATKLEILADVRANVPALAAVLTELDREAPDGIVFLGDSIDIGPHPREALDLLLARDDIRFVQGNHDLWYAEGLPTPQPSWMSDAEREHEEWTHHRLCDDYLVTLRSWAPRIDEAIEDAPVQFVHYTPRLNSRALDELFERTRSIVFYGHDHATSDVDRAARYINPGPLGYGRQPVARYRMATFAGGRAEIELREAAYDRQAVLSDYDRLQVPDRDTIRKFFFGVGTPFA
jgi:predicted phosphodiesterase